MGDAASVKEQLLIAFMQDLPAAMVEDIHAKFPNAEITIINLERMAPIPSGSSYTHCISNDDADLRLEYARKATILVTFTNLPNMEDSAK